MGRWFHEMRTAVERHGGAVENYIGDAVMATFGAKVLHEDDALRAARSALEMHDGLSRLNEELKGRFDVTLRMRTGLNTGEVAIATGPEGEPLTLGDAVNVAQRLETAARPGEVLVGAETARMLGPSARVEPVEGLSLKGKAEPVAAWRLISVAAGGVEASARPRTPFVGRRAELRTLEEALREVVAGRGPRAITLLGPAGIGKSRVVETALADAGEQATVAVGRCLPYGEGITYWPLAEIVRQLAGAATESALRDLVGRGPEGEDLVGRVARAAGFAAGAVPLEETQWAVRKLFEGVARRRPLVVVFEDIHWAESTLLELLENVTARADDAPLLLILLARPELLERHPTWLAGASERSARLSLGPLPQDHATDLLDRLTRDLALRAEDRAHVLAAAEGNPFFLHQLAAMRTETPGSQAGVPPTIQAVLAARIDGLPRFEAALLGQASVEGRTFHRGALARTSDERERTRLDAGLAGLCRRELIRPARPDFADEEAFSFSHILIRDAAYALLPKAARADLHEAQARWLEQRVGDQPREYAEILGYHLERAFRCRLDIEPAAEHAHRDLAAKGGRLLGDAGRAALGRGDVPAAISLLGRALDLLPADDPAQGRLTPELGSALSEAGRLSDARRVLREAVVAGAGRGDRVAEAHALVCELLARLQVETQDAAHEALARFDALRATFEGAGDELGLDRLWRLRALISWIRARSAEADTAWGVAAEHARRAEDQQGLADALSWLASSALAGPLPASEGIARCEQIRAQLTADRRSASFVLHSLAGLRAMRGEFEQARALLAQSNDILDELGVTMHSAVSHEEAFVALESGDTAGAERTLRSAYDRLVGMGERALLATTAAMLARALLELGRSQEAWAFTTAAEDAAAADDLSAQILWRSVRARLCVERGEAGEADRLSAESVALAEDSDWLTDHADALVARAQVLGAIGDAAAAGDALRESLSLYERKEHSVGARRARSLLETAAPA
jgi:hypothetical protein